MTLTFNDPKVQKLWEEHKGIVFWAARRLTQTFRGSHLDYLGTLTIRFAQAAQTWEEGAGSKFGSYFCWHFHTYVLNYFLKYESEAWDIYVSNKQSTPSAQKEQGVQYTYHEVNDYYLYRVPDEDDDLLSQVMESFESINECWNFFTRYVDSRSRWVLEQRFREDRTLQSLADEIGISKERVRQIEAKALERIRERLKLVQRFTELFQKRMDEE